MTSIASKPDEEESFIILGSSPGTSLDFKCDGIDPPSLDRGALNDAMKDLPEEASNAFKAHFQLNEGPSTTSLMVASTLVTDDKSTEELQKQFGELLDENIILKETLKQNNESMKEQFLMIASCQEDMMKTHLLHKEKFDETRELVEKLRQENKKLKLDVARLAEAETQKSASLGQSSNASGESSSGPMSALEFVTSPDDDTINKLTAQLELVEKQRRQVIVENEKLTWQKESLENIVDATSKERDDLKEKLKKLELQLSSVENEYTQKVNLLNGTILDLNVKLDSANRSMSSVSPEELCRRDEVIRQLEAKVSALQNDLKHAQLKILDLENVKLEFSKYRSGWSETIKMYKEQIQELQNKLKDAQTTVFQPVRVSLGPETDSAGSECPSFMTNIKLHDKTLKHLAEYLNLIAYNNVDSLVQCLGVVASLQDVALDRSNVEQVKLSLTELRLNLSKQHDTALSNIGQVRSTLTIFEGIFKDCSELIVAATKTKLTRQETNVEQLTAALVARGEELQLLQGELNALREHKEDTEVMKAQLDLYKSDFEAEREAREKMACEKESILADLRTMQRRNQELMSQLQSATSKRPTGTGASTGPQSSAGGPQSIPRGAPTARPQSTPRGPSAGPQAPGNRRPSAPGTTTGNMVYTCPKCNRFSSDQYKVMEDHFDFCLDDF